MNVLDQLRQVIAETFDIPVSSVDEGSQAGEVQQWDSLGHVSLMMSVEQSFNIELDVEDFPKLDSVAAILEHLKSRGIG